MRIFAFYAMAFAVCALLGGTAARAAEITGQLWLNRSDVAGDARFDNLPKLGAPDATFTSDAINYDSTIGGFTVGGFLNHPIFSDPGVAGRDLFDTVILLTGSIALTAGENSFNLAHDDGVQLDIAGIGRVVDEPGPTAPVSTLFHVFAPTAGNYDFQLIYGECCAPPGELVLAVNAVPEPASLGLLVTALVGCGMAIRARRREP